MMGTNCKCDFKSWLINGFVIAVLYLGLDLFFHQYCLKTIYSQRDVRGASLSFCCRDAINYVSTVNLIDKMEAMW